MRSITFQSFVVRIKNAFLIAGKLTRLFGMRLARKKPSPKPMALRLPPHKIDK